MDIIKLINEEINEVLAYGEIPLESAQRYYGTLVSWVLGPKDLNIINMMRRQYLQDKDEMYSKTYRDKQEDALSALWDNHMRQTKEALWKAAQK
jgi:hypothetical protein